MMKITHIQKGDENYIAQKVHEYIKRIYPAYFEVKVYHNGENHSPTMLLMSEVPK